MTDLSIYDKKSVLQLFRNNIKFTNAVAAGKPWNDILKIIESEGAKCSKEQIEYIKNYVNKKATN
jgi:hypothetical protein